ncbi:MAG: basic amino acid ABC transporter substrate-binding protein [Succinivibrio sp.]|nr:basic amino acid ABC transporter substrate-binding protein [Succinivibrio sp.]
MFRFLAKMLLCVALLCGSNAVLAAQKVLHVGCEGGFAPFTYINESGTLVGFDIDIIRIIGKSLGYDVQITVYPFDGLIPALITDNIDVIISGFSITPERGKKVDFSNPYYLCDLTYMFNKQDESKYPDYESLNGEKVCVQLGTAGAAHVENTLKNAKIKQYNSPAETYLELQNHGCVAVVNDRPVQDFFLTKNTDKNFMAKPVGSEQSEYYGIAVNKGNAKLLQEINKGLKQVLNNGEFARVSKLWFGYDISETLGF